MESDKNTMILNVDSNLVVVDSETKHDSMLCHGRDIHAMWVQSLVVRQNTRVKGSEYNS
jgi:hypothetical protein